MRKLLGVVIALLLVSPANAEWRMAESDHFVIYADDSEKDVQRFATILETYHAAMERLTGRTIEKPSPSNRVTVYTVGTTRDVQSLAETKSRLLAGFYIPRAGGSVAFVPDLRSTRGEPDESLSVLLHEYAHHFLIASQRFAMPLWMSEGAAEFFSSASFEPSGAVHMGKPNRSRGYELFNAVQVPIRQLLDETEYRKKASRSYDAFYGRSWLLYHYLSFSPERNGQLTAYWKETARGTPHIAAAEKVFGDLDALEKELDRYLRARRMKYVPIEPGVLSTGPVTVSALSEGHARMLPVIMTSKRGVNSGQAAALVVRARAVAAKFPADPEVQAAIAEAEFDAGNHAEAIAAADRAITADPKTKNAFVQKGLALFALASKADDQAGAYKKAMEPFSALNKLENDHPYPLMYYYRSFVERGQEPTKTARHALERASVLAPFDLDLAFNVAKMLAQEGKITLARTQLQPVASNPHGGSLATEAKALSDYLKPLPDGKPADLSAYNSSLSGADERDQGEAPGVGPAPA